MSKATYTLNRNTIALIGLLIIGLFTLNIILVAQNSNLKPSSTKDREVVLKSGKKVMPFSGIDINEKKLTFDWGVDKRKTLFLIFSPNCGYCHETMPMWNDIIKKADKKIYRVIAASSVADGTKEFIKDFNVEGIPIIVETEPNTKLDYVMYLTPQTVIVDKNGVVEKVWIGPIEGDNKLEVEKDLNIKLIDEIVQNK